MTLDTLTEQIRSQFDTLSNRLQQAARYALEHPNEIALDTVTVLASRAGVQPSVFVRLSKAFGFSGFSNFQKVFQSALADKASNYSERVRRLKDLPEKESVTQTHSLQRFCELNSDSLLQLARSMDAKSIKKAAQLINDAFVIYVAGERRSFPIATYLDYAFTRTGKKSKLLAGQGGTLRDEIATIDSGDVLIAISMHPYTSGTLEAVERVAEKGGKIIAITDGQMTPVSRHAAVTLEVRDVDFLGFRSIIAQTCLAQSLAISVADISGHTEPRITT